MTIKFIAEIGINHNGSLELCRKLIDVAFDAKCDAVKFQKRDIDVVYPSKLLNSQRDSPWGNTFRDQKAALEFSFADYSEIDRYCNELGIDWFFSAWDLNSQLGMNKFNCKFNKIASAMNISKKFMEAVASEGKHTFISTGMSTIDQIDEMVEIFIKKNCSYELMHCVSTYPMKASDANLMMIQTLRNRYNCNVGYSGHESGLAISYAAAALGVSSIERHITLDRAMYGSDQSASLEPAGLKQLVGGIRKIEEAMGDGIKKYLPEEKLISDKLREHLPRV